MIDQALRDRVRQFTPEDRLELISELWESLDTDALPVTDAERELLEQRLAALRADPDTGRSWEAVRADLRTRR